VRQRRAESVKTGERRHDARPVLAVAVEALGQQWHGAVGAHEQTSPCLADECLRWRAPLPHLRPVLLLLVVAAAEGEVGQVQCSSAIEIPNRSTARRAARLSTSGRCSARASSGRPAGGHARSRQPSGSDRTDRPPPRAPADRQASPPPAARPQSGSRARARTPHTTFRRRPAGPYSLCAESGSSGELRC
jgi:hypothetical protein